MSGEVERKEEKKILGWVSLLQRALNWVASKPHRESLPQCRHGGGGGGKEQGCKLQLQGDLAITRKLSHGEMGGSTPLDFTVCTWCISA